MSENMKKEVSFLEELAMEKMLLSEAWQYLQPLTIPVERQCNQKHRKKPKSSAMCTYAIIK
jgi:hypothetical protein